MFEEPCDGYLQAEILWNQEDLNDIMAYLWVKKWEVVDSIRISALFGAMSVLQNLLGAPHWFGERRLPARHASIKSRLEAFIVCWLFESMVVLS